ncbi:MAG: hypothetical protein H6825_10145 [Planctomycetes bacterium]|nr:hypothetical protein [Planctomycetota bacterium]
MRDDAFAERVREEARGELLYAERKALAAGDADAIVEKLERRYRRYAFGLLVVSLLNLGLIVPAALGRAASESMGGVLATLPQISHAVQFVLFAVFSDAMRRRARRFAALRGGSPAVRTADSRRP